MAHYRKKQLQELIDWTPDFPMELVSISEADKSNGSPKEGDKIAYNPKDPNDMWLVAKQFFDDNYEFVSQNNEFLRDKTLLPTPSSRTLYVVEMLRWGDREQHSYVIGVFDSMEQAKQCGEIEKSWRGGGKYEYEVKSIVLNDFDDPDGEKYENHEQTRPRNFTYSLNMTGPWTLDWYRVRGLLRDGQPTDPYAGGRIDIRGDTESPYGDEYSVSPMRAADWHAFNEWLGYLDTTYQWSYNHLLEVFERETGITIRWA